MMRVIGLISGTSVDGIDAALVEISGLEADLKVQLLSAQTYPYPPELRAEILAVCAGKALSMAELAALDDQIAYCFAESARLIQNEQPAAELIGSHGQTVYHRPPQPGPVPLGYSLQLGRGAAIAFLTQITTISNFRVADLAVLGQGAPLVSRVDVCLLGHPTLTRCIQNLGGIGNVTYLPASPMQHLDQVYGWDTGPGNALLDVAVHHYSNGAKTYDQDGAWAASGTVCQALLDSWLAHKFFRQPPPKSTGREEFGVEFCQRCLQEAQIYDLTPADVLASLSELTAASIALNYRQFLPKMPDQVLLCGGGSRNLDLRRRLDRYLDPIPVLTTDEVGLNSDFKEAIAFAVLAYWRYRGIVGNLPQVTGAQQPMLLGEIHPSKLVWK